MHNINLGLLYIFNDFFLGGGGASETGCDSIMYAAKSYRICIKRIVPGGLLTILFGQESLPSALNLRLV